MGKWFNNLKMSQKLVSVFLLVAIFVGIVNFIGIHSINTLFAYVTFVCFGGLIIYLIIFYLVFFFSSLFNSVIKK